MDRRITSVDLDDVMDQQESDGMGHIDLDISMLAQDQREHSEMPGVFSRIFPPRAIG
jgi:hypothetical protein